MYYLKKAINTVFFYALIIGSMLIIGIYNLILFFIFKDPSYAALSIAIISQTFMASHNNGLYQQVTAQAIISTPIINAMYLITIVSSLDFIRRIIEAKYFVPFMNKLLLSIEFSFLAMLVTITSTPYVIPVINAFIPILFLVVLIAVIRARQKGKYFATSLVIIIPVYLITLLPRILTGMGVIDDWTPYLQLEHIGFLLTIVLLSSAIPADAAKPAT